MTAHGGPAIPTARVAAAPDRFRLAALGIILVLTAGGLLARPVLPAESEILSAAWEHGMGQATAATLGAPPLLVGLAELVWSLFGTGAWPVRLLTPGFALGALLLIAPVARRLWPDQPLVERYAALLIFGTLSVAAHMAVLSVGPPLLFATLLALLGLSLAGRGARLRGWGAFSVALAVALLASPLPAVALAAMAVIVNMRSGRAWLAPFIGIAAAIALAGAWLAATGMLPQALWWGGLLWAQPLTEITGFAALALVGLYPWIAWRSLWHAIRARGDAGREPAARLCAIMAAALAGTAILRGSASELLAAIAPAALLAARLIAADERSPRDFHALVPGFLLLFVGLVFFLLNIVPFAHLDAVWRELSHGANLPIWLGGTSLASGLILIGGGYVLAQITPRHMVAGLTQLAILPLLLMTAVNLEFALSLRSFFDLRPVAAEIRTLQDRGHPVATYGLERQPLSFPGQLSEPLFALHSRAEALDWAESHPSGVILSTFHGSVLRLPTRPIHVGPLGSRWAALWPAEAVRASRGDVLAPRF